MSKHYNIKVLLTSGTNQYWIDQTIFDVVRIEVGTNHYLLVEEDGMVNYFPINFTIIKEIEDNRP